MTLCVRCEIKEAAQRHAGRCRSCYQFEWQMGMRGRKRTPCEKGCSSPAVARGLCKLCYEKWRRTRNRIVRETKPYIPRRTFPVEPLHTLIRKLEMSGFNHAQIANRAHVSRRVLVRLLGSSHPLSEAMADKWALRLGRMPEDLWDDWYDDLEVSA